MIPPFLNDCGGVKYRTICEMFDVLCDEIKGITFGKFFQLIVETLIASVVEIFHATEEQLQALMNNFFQN